MITKNLRALLAGYTNNSNYYKSVMLKDETGYDCVGGAYLGGTSSVIAGFIKTNVRESSGAGSTYSYCTLKVGTGTTEPTADDYCLESEDSALTYVSGSASGNYTDKNLSMGGSLKTVVATFINNTTEAVTIKEVGFFVNYADSYNLDGTNKTSRNFLMAREVIDPVEIGAGETYTFTFVIQ